MVRKRVEVGDAILHGGWESGARKSKVCASENGGQNGSRLAKATLGSCATGNPKRRRAVASGMPEEVNFLGAG